MTLKVYNSLTRTKEEFQPIVPGKVKMYVCGPTVYSYIHIGNARPLVFFDVVRRYLRRVGYEVTYVVNFTDVDDKLIRKAEEMGLTVTEVADRFIEAYYEDAQGLGIEAADIHPRVTEHLPEIIEFIDGLITKDFAYSVDGDVYFRTEKFAEYGQLSHQNLEELQFGIRIEVDERKESPRDFVLWKRAKQGEISWGSPWGAGRPGWHIECSAMAKRYLGDTLDIHGGGHDLLFPHHECELAQSKALNGVPLANYWMHNGYIHINNEKMAKSLGNGINVNQLLAEISPQLVRFFILSSHYRNPLNYSDEAISKSQHSLERIHNCVHNVRDRLRHAAAEGEIESSVREAVDQASRNFHEKMEDDFNTPDAITAIFELVSLTNVYLEREDVNQMTLQYIDKLFQEINEVLGVLAAEEQEWLDEHIEQLISERTNARKDKNWTRADEIRDLLTSLGIVLEDTPQGIRWRRG